MATHKVLINGQWSDSDHSGTFQAEDPSRAAFIDGDYPISRWSECERALDAAQAAYDVLRGMPRVKVAEFLESFADRLDARSAEICGLATQETALPVEPRLASGEMPRTTGQLRQAAEAVRSGSWCQPTIDTATNIRSIHGSIGPVAVFGPNNFPFAFGSISGGDFAAAIAAGNPVIGKANSMHPGTTRLIAEEAQLAAEATGMPAGTVQMIYRMSHEDGERLVRDPRLAAVGYTGSRHAGLKLKAAADAVGKPIYLELSSVNPVIVLPHAIAERSSEIAAELTGSCLMGTGQFCTSPGVVIVQRDEHTDSFIGEVQKNLTAAPTGTLLSHSGQKNLLAAIETLKGAGAELLCGGEGGAGNGYSVSNSLLQVSGSQFLKHHEQLQTEAFGNATMMVVVDSIDQAIEVTKSLEGNLTGCIYSATNGDDDQAYDRVAPHLRQRVGRLLNDKMPTGVAVSAAMNHGGPFPATGHPGFTAVGMPGSIVRFAMLQCFDNVRSHRLPDLLKDENPKSVWRRVDGQWTTGAAG